MLDLTRQYARIRDEVRAAIDRVCESQQLIFGPELEAFEQGAAKFTGSAACVGCASGTDAIWLALAACGVGPGDEVLTTPFSFFATISSIVRAGARAVLVDVDPETLNLSPERLQDRLAGYFSARLKAILPVHLYGQCADIDALSQIAQERKLVIVEDAAQAFGAAWRGRRAGSLGRAAAFSFYPTKNLSAFGDAGCVTTVDPEVAERARHLRNHGSKQRYHHLEIGGNSRLDAIQAAVLNVKLKHLEQWNEERRRHAAAYDRLLAKAGLVGGAQAPLRLLKTRSEAHHIYHQYVVRSAKRDELRAFLKERGVATEVYYPVPLHLQPPLKYFGYGEGSFPESERACREVLALPMFAELTEGEQQYVVESIAAFF
ncbi:MAG TPA: DegT/DnrJ/EryC1/StrS family aminotransferase [Terriglobales bacterium]|nr:DegT/DnrJ/EryC1/StrS family aminotransferase [Terriglobales bacterium]